MNPNIAFGSNLKSDSVPNADETLRLIANLPAPGGIEGRVISGLRSTPRSRSVLNWPRLWNDKESWFRSAAAAAIVCVIVGGSWGVYSRVQSTAAAIVRPHAGSVNGFSNAGAVRVPQTLPVAVVAPPASDEPQKAHRKAKAQAPKKSKTNAVIKPATGPSVPAER